MIDAHSHLYSDKFDHDLHRVIQRARESLEGVVISAVDPKSLQKSLSIRRQYPDFIYVTAGVHPRTTARLNKRNLSHLWQAIRHVKDKIVAVGEVGPDFHHIKHARQRERQLLALEEALVNAIKHGNRMDSAKTVTVRYAVGAKRIVIEIQDQGPGFNPGSVPDPTLPENLENPSGRGLMLMRVYMDDVKHLGCGNCVRMTKSR